MCQDMHVLVTTKQMGQIIVITTLLQLPKTSKNSVYSYVYKLIKQLGVKTLG